MVRNITTIKEVDLFCQQNIYEILQKVKRWIKINDLGCNISKKLFAKAYVFAGAATEQNFFKKMSKVKRVPWARNFDNAIQNWLNSKYPERSHFSEVDQLLYQAEIAKKLAEQGGEKNADEVSDNCQLNWGLYVECDESCTMGSGCQNREVQNSDSTSWKSKLEVKYINPIVGVGILAAKPLQPEEFLGHITGEALNIEEYTKRSSISHYIFGVSDDESSLVRAIDQDMFGNYGRFFNHSCSPNVCFEVWTISGFKTVKLRVLPSSPVIQPVIMSLLY